MPLTTGSGKASSMQSPVQIITKDRADLSQFLVHLTRNGSYEQYVDIGNNKYTWRNSDIIRAEDSLASILSMKPKSIIEARSPLGYFKFKIDTRWKNRGGVHPDWIKCVCFSETPLSEMKYFYRATIRKRNQYQKFGLAFWSDTIRKRGGNPVFYVDTSKKPLLGCLDTMVPSSTGEQFRHMMPLMEHFGPPLYGGRAVQEIDFRWEREWRIPGNFAFSLPEVAFGICPENRISEFDTRVKNVFPFLDPDWDADKIKSHLEQKGSRELLEAL
jgi:hypothetical protein